MSRRSICCWDFCENQALTNSFLCADASVESIRKQIEERTKIVERVSTSVDLPLSDECKRVVAHAGQEAKSLSHRFIGTEHLLLGLLWEENCVGAQLLKQRGVSIEVVRTNLHRNSAKIQPPEEPK
jgi:ATP-dependent Clp protease ATP-binding subunit ClpC